MKCKIIVIISLCIMLFMNGCKNSIDNNIFNGLSVTKYSDAVKKYYEETSNGYKAAFYEKGEIDIDKITNWLDSCKHSKGYNQYIYSDPDSWDMFIYYSPENSILNGNSFKFSVDGSIVKIYVTNDSSVNISADYILIRIQAPIRGTWSNSSELYLDDIKIEMQNNEGIS